MSVVADDARMQRRGDAPRGSTPPAVASAPPAADHARPSDPDYHLTQEFFSPPAAQARADTAEVWDDEIHLPVMTHGARRAMYATLGLLAISVLWFVGYMGYTRLVMPVPVELGHGSGLPSTLALQVAPPTPTTNPAAVVAPPLATTPPAVAAAANPIALAAVAPANNVQDPAQPQPAVAPVQAAAAALGPAPAPAATGPAPSAAQPTVAQPAAAAPVATNVVPGASLSPLVVKAGDAPLPPSAVTAEAPGTSSPLDPALAGMLASAGSLYERGQRKQALAAYEQVLERDPNVAQALSKIAYIHLDTAHNRRAAEFAQRAIAADPQSSEAWIVLGAAREALGDRPGARTAYRTCASLSGPYAAECRRLGR